MSLVLRRYKFYFTLLKVFDKEDVLVGRGKLQVLIKHGKRELGAILLNVPNVGDRVAEVLNFRFNVGGMDGECMCFSTTR
jgi:hypothetical protein